MSSTLKWRPLVPVEGYSLPDKLKYVLSRKVWDTDGSIGNGDAEMDRSAIPYLQGLRDAGIEGANDLISAIEKHGQIIIWHEH